MTCRPARFAVSALVAVALAATAGCAGTPSGGGTPTTTGSGHAASPAPPTPTATAAPRCETIIPQTTVATLKQAGWSAQAEPFRIDDTELSGGVQCTWGDPSVASDHVQVYGWAPISDAQASAARASLLANGWRELDEKDGHYITAGAEMIMDPDDQGYGMTYQFGDGWVKVADTKQGLLLVDWPPGH